MAGLIMCVSLPVFVDVVLTHMPFFCVMSEGVLSVIKSSCYWREKSSLRMKKQTIETCINTPEGDRME